MAKNKPQDNLVTMTEHRQIQIEVDQETFIQRAEELEVSLEDRDELEREKKRWLKEWNGEFSKNQKVVKELRKAVATHKENKTVPCRAEYRESENKVVVTDPDGAVIEERPMMQADHEYCESQRQAELPATGEDASAVG